MGFNSAFKGSNVQYRNQTMETSLNDSSSVHFFENYLVPINILMLLYRPSSSI